jgi:hypothetical protein
VCIYLFNFSRFAEISGAVCLTTTGETVKLWIIGYLGDLVMHYIAAQHTEMPMVISAASAFCLVFHV